MSAMNVLHPSEEISARVTQLGQEISRDFRGRTLDVVAVLENAFIFVADLVRALEVPVRTHFVRAEMRDILDPNTGRERKEIFFTPEVDTPEGATVLVVEGVLQSGVTTDFLLRRIGIRRPEVVKTVICVDKPVERKVLLEPDYAAFRIASNDIVVGYGLAWDGLNANLPYLATVPRPARAEAAAESDADLLAAAQALEAAAWPAAPAEEPAAARPKKRRRRKKR